MFWQRRSRGGRRNANGVSVPVSKGGYIGTNILSRGDTTRSILEFAGSQYGEMVTAWEPSGDFEIEVVFSCTADSGTQPLFGSAGQSGGYVDATNSRVFWQISATSGNKYAPGSAAGSVVAGKVHTAKWVKVGDDYHVELDGTASSALTVADADDDTIARVGRLLSGYFTGNILSVKLTDTAGGDNRHYTLSDGRTDYTLASGSGLGSDLVTNGTFDTDSDWTKGTGWTISGGTASSDGSQAAGEWLTNDELTFTSGDMLLVEFDITAYSAGGVRARFSSTNRNAVGSYSELLTADNELPFGVIADADFVGSIDNVSVKQLPDTGLILNNFTSDHVAEYTYQTSIAHDDGTVAAAWVGSELIVNGTFDTDSDWTKSAGATIATGLLTLDSASDVYAYQDIMTIGSRYLVACNYAAQADTTGLYVGSNGGSGTGIIELSAVAGTYAATGIVAASAARFTFRDADGCESTVDSVSAKHLLEIA